MLEFLNSTNAQKCAMNNELDCIYLLSVHLKVDTKDFMKFNRSRSSFGRGGFQSKGRSRSRFSGGNNRRSFRGGGTRFGQFIDPSRFINKALVVEQEVKFTPKHKFTDFNFHPILAKNLASRGYVLPTAIQDQMIPFVAEGRDVIGLANTGTGKTAAFLLPIIQKMLEGNSKQLLLVIAPTRELAMQINTEFSAFTQGAGLRSALCVGGMSMYRQISDLSRRPNVIIGTPGRLKDHIRRRTLNLSQIGFLVLDEVDRMLDMGFVKEIRELITQLPSERQSIGISATITSAVEQLLVELLRNPVTVSVKTGDTSKNVEQDIVQFDTPESKIATLKSILQKEETEKVIVFGETKRGVQELADTLTRSGIPAEAIHGNKSQPQRHRALQAFKIGKIMALVATDVAARGLDIPDVTHVINYDQPQTYDDYIHRIGRTGRAGKRGMALTFVTASAARNIR